MTYREQEERKLIERFWRVHHKKPDSDLVAEPADWAFYQALLNARPENLLPVGAL